jgi:hypothetical protein
MAWFEKEMDYARESLEKISRESIDRAAEKLNGVVKEGIAEASGELREVVLGASKEVDAKLDKISAELHSQRSLTKDDITEVVDYAAAKLATTIDDRVAVIKSEITSLMQEKIEYLKSEVDDFFVKRQQDIARERRRLLANVLIAVSASIMVGIFSLMYNRYAQGGTDLFGIFRAVFAALAGGYAAYLAVSFVRRYLLMSEHKKDLVFLAMRYWGVLRPESIFGHVLLLAILAALFTTLFFPETVAQWTGSDILMRWAAQVRGGPRP